MRSRTLSQPLRRFPEYADRSLSSNAPSTVHSRCLASSNQDTDGLKLQVKDQLEKLIDEDRL